MLPRYAELFFPILAIAACMSEKEPGPAEPESVLPFLNLSPEELTELGESNWVERGTSRICAGYLTRFDNEDYCASKVPDDWVPFEYNGETYYVQPLSRNSEKQR